MNNTGEVNFFLRKCFFKLPLNITCLMKFSIGSEGGDMGGTEIQNPDTNTEGSIFDPTVLMFDVSKVFQYLFLIC